MSKERLRNAAIDSLATNRNGYQMEPKRKAEAVIVQLLKAMDDTVLSYHPTVVRTNSTVEGLIQGTAFFPGGAGLWRGSQNFGEMPEGFPESPIMFVGHNFDSQLAYERSLSNGGEVSGHFWSRLRGMLKAAGLCSERCFFTNALMGLKPGSALGPMPSVAGYKDECRAFLARQVEIVDPSTIVALGDDAYLYVRRLEIAHTKLRHPTNRYFNPLITRDVRIREEGMKLREFLDTFGLEKSGNQCRTDAV